MDRVLLALALAAIAVVVAVVAQRRRTPDAPVRAIDQHRAPSQLDRADFDRPDAPWLVAVFTSAMCSSCAEVWAKSQVLGSDAVVVQELEETEAKELHRRYGVTAVPTVAIANADGQVLSSFIGPVSSTHLWAALADLREPGTVPPGCGGH